MATYPDLHWFRHSALPMIKSTTKWLLLAIITRKKRQPLAFSHYRLPHLLRPPENKNTRRTQPKKKRFTFTSDSKLRNPAGHDALQPYLARSAYHPSLLLPRLVCWVLHALS